MSMSRHSNARTKKVRTEIKEARAQRLHADTILREPSCHLNGEHFYSPGE